MSALLAIINILVMLAAFPAQERPGEFELLAERNKQLEAEIALAGKKAVYGVIDVEGRAVDVKARGVVLKSMPALQVREFGRLPGAGPLLVLRKKAFSEPRREKVKPQNEDNAGAAADQSSDTFQIKALELADMPASYNIYVEEGLVIRVMPGGSIAGGPRALLARAWGACVRPFRTLADLVRGGRYSELDIVMKEDDARALYWHMGDGMSVFIAR